MNSRTLVWFALILVLLTEATFADLFYATPGSVISEDFNSLSGSGLPATNSWTNNSTLSGWYSNAANYIGSNGGSSSNGFYSFRSLEVTGAPAADRALGAIAAANTVVFGVAIQNTSGVTLDSVNVSYDGEQWRQGNANATSIKSLAVEYRVTSQLGTLNDAGFTAVPSLNFNSRINSASSGIQLDGNLAANRTQLSQTIDGANWQNGDFLWIRWRSQLVSGFEVGHGMAVDNFAFSAVVSVPEPSSVLMLTTAGAVFGLLGIRKLKSKTQA